MKNLLLTEELSIVDDRICPPPTLRPADLGDLLSIVAERLAHDGVLMLDASWSRYIEPYAAAGGPQDAPTVLHAGDWTARVVKDDTWIRWTNPHLVDGSRRFALWTAEVDAIPSRGKDSPLIEPDPVLTASNFHQWTDATGVPWVGTPGMAGNALLVDGWQQMNPRSAAPYWSGTGIMTNEGVNRWPFGPIEQVYAPVTWSRGHDGPLHGYDLNMAYLSAYTVVELAGDQLEHHRREFDPRQAGIWRVELSPWTYSNLLPDPAGYAPALDDGTRWLTTPTLTLLQELTDRGDYGGFTVREAWTAPGRRITRKWAELIRDMAGAARDPLGTAAKQVYKQTYGMWARGGRVRRPDWHYAIIAQNRANLWRKMDAAARNGFPTLTSAGTVPPHMCPVRVETDCVFYGGITDWERDAPHGFRLDPSGRKLGHFKPYEPKGDR